jgi:hypothetical protein
VSADEPGGRQIEKIEREFETGRLTASGPNLTRNSGFRLKSVWTYARTPVRMTAGESRETERRRDLPGVHRRRVSLAYHVILLLKRVCAPSAYGFLRPGISASRTRARPALAGSPGGFAPVPLSARENRLDNP